MPPLRPYRIPPATDSAVDLMNPVQEVDRCVFDGSAKDDMDVVIGEDEDVGKADEDSGEEEIDG